MPLPEGDWLLIVNTFRKNGTARVPTYYPRLVQIKDNVIQKLIVVDNSTAGPEAMGFSGAQNFFRECRRTDMHYVKEITNYDNGHQNCWWVNHVGMTSGNQVEAETVELYKYFSERRIPMPTVMLMVAYHLSNTSTRNLNMRFYYNPEAVGFEPPQSSEWRSADWHKDRVTSDPKKQEYIAQLTNWATFYHERVKQGFEGKLGNETKVSAQSPASSPLPATTTSPTATTSTTAPNLNIETRLKEAEALFQKRLITKDEYDKKRKDILGGL